MRIAILTSGRFHVLDLARELASFGHDVRFYSLLPRWRTRQFGLPDECNQWLGPYVAPFYAAAFAARGTAAQSLMDNALIAALDVAASKLIAPCDAFIGMSGMCLRTIEHLRRGGGGTRIFLERGSKHIVEQRRILQEAWSRQSGHGRRHLSAWTVARELAEYALVDRVSVPSRHAARSFVERGFPEDQLLVNPYGVALDMFRAHLHAPTGTPT
ncbi:MAG: hypothetical protein ACHREM_33760, partial [Polyangiales bacterium]